ncbi:enoyl-CoA hydratase/isomerase family protein [Halanaerobiaceae bacterium Z-7014]|uniref:short-chain-enoyl-CoA hydratase n=1 Tax=Halonatronomonas betaini TaxID=2778430 RepID=A0A931AT50_9FIRM|nr:enoyl-CoA hydratase-related protein [Halonatronomonas betaini]MBF8437421.1 enoyl-CoA hydratase/isomerase family protein [Halonatronomonas betaini]
MIDNLKNLQFEMKDDYGIIFIDRVKQHNSLNLEVIAEFKRLLLKLEKKSLRALIITGNGEKSFIAGADIGEMKELTMAEAREFSQEGHQLMQQIEEFPAPVIAAVNGFSLGGGNELMMACDLAIAEEKAVFGQPETGLGIMPGFGGTQRLARLIGERKAKYLLYTGEKIDAERAVEIGLVNKVVENGSSLEAAEKIAAKIAKQAPVAVKMTKEAINYGIDAGVERGNSFEINAFSLCFGTEDKEVGLEAFFNKERPDFTGK